MRRILIGVAVAICAMATFASVSRADTLNVVSATSNVVEPATVPVDSLPAAFNQPGGSNGTQYTGPTSTSSSPAAGGDDNYSESFTFDYGGAADTPNSSDGNPDQTVQTLNLNLPPGLLASLAAAKDFCTPAQLGTMPTATDPGTGWLGDAPNNEGCPAGAQIGELAGTANALGLSVPITGNLYLEKATSSSDIAQVGVEVDGNLFGTIFRAQVASGPIRFVTDQSGQPQLQVSLTLPPQAALADGASAPAAGTTLPYVLTNLTQTINGLTPAGTPFGRMPTSDAPAAGTTAVTVQYNGGDDGSGTPPTAGDTVPGATGSGSASITPTGAASLPYGPQLSANVARDGADYNVALNTTITQAAGEAASRGIVLALPSSLQPNLTTALTALCTTPTADASNCQPIGTVTADTPLLPTPLTGQVYLTGSTAGPALTLSFPPPVGFALSGAVDLRDHTVTFPDVPDLPLTRLSVDIAGGAGGIYETTCTSAANTGAVTGAFTGQNGASGSSSGAFTVANCPASANLRPQAVAAPTSHLTGPPTVKARVRGLTATGGRLTLQVRRARNSTPFTAVTVSAPAGIRYVPSEARYAVAGIGARITSASVYHGRLRVVLRDPRRSLYLTIHRAAFTESPALARRIASHRVTTLRLGVAFTTTSLKTLTISASAPL